MPGHWPLAIVASQDPLTGSRGLSRKHVPVRTLGDTWMIQDIPCGARDVQVLLRSTLIYGVVPSRSAIQSQILVPWRPLGLISTGAAS